MQNRDSNQHSVPNDAPKRSVPEPKVIGEEEENIIKGANQQDQLDRLKPSKDEDKAPNQIGSPPLKEEGNDG